MAEHLFLFVQLEFPWELGPPDGRYLIRSSAGAEPERVVVLETLGARVRVSEGLSLTVNVLHQSGDPRYRPNALDVAVTWSVRSR